MEKKASVAETQVLRCYNCEDENPKLRVLERGHGPARYDERLYCDKDCARARQRDRSQDAVAEEMAALKKLTAKYKKGTIAHEAFKASYRTYDAMLKRNTFLYLGFKKKAEAEWTEVLAAAPNDRTMLRVAEHMKRWSDMCLCAQAYVDLPVEPDSDEAVLVD